MLALVDHDSVVLVDGVEATRRMLAGISERSPRLLAVTVFGEDHARSVRKALLSVQPWCDLHSINSSLARLVVAQYFSGLPYDRDRVLDMRAGGRA